MRLTGSRPFARPAPTPTMPPGLVELMEGLAKDVLKNNPENVYEFCAGHMQKLLEIRDGRAPPRKQLSLEKKIADAQERIRQRIKKRHLQRDGNTSEHSNENHNLEDKSPVIEVPMETTSAIQPVVKTTIENISSIQPDLETAIETTPAIQSVAEIPTEKSAAIPFVLKTAIRYTPAIQSVVEIPTENTSAPPVVHGEKLIIANEVEIFHEPDVIITANDTSTDEASHQEHDNDEQSREASQIARELEEDEVVATQKLDTVNSTEKESEEVSKNNISVATKKKSDIEANVESGNVTDLDVQSKDAVDHKIGNVEHAENTPQITDDETQLKESKPTVSEIANSAEVIDGALDKEVTKDELNEVVKATPLLANNNDAVLSHIDDAKLLEKDIVEEQEIVRKEEMTDIWHEKILIEKYANVVEPEGSINGVLEKQEIIKQEESADIHPEVIMTEKEDNVEFNESIKDSKCASEENIVEQNRVKLLLQTDSTVGALTTHQIETPDQTETILDKNQTVLSTNAETSEISDFQVSETEAKLLENLVITVEMTEKATVYDSLKNDVDHHDVHNNQVNYGPDVGKILNDNNNKLPEQERAHCGELIAKDTEDIQDCSIAFDKNDTIIESDETQESTAVSGMDLETAAITIQKVFRTFLFSKSRASTLDDTVNENSMDDDSEKKDEPEYILTSSNLNKERRTLGISRMDTVLQTVNEEKSLSLSDDSSLSSAATTIQAHVRGFLVRNRLASTKTASSSSLVNSDGPSTLSLDEPKKTILNIHIVPERGQFMSRDESLLTSIDLPLDNSPPSSINLRYDKSAERRKQLKREDAVQSISPPSNNSGKLSEEINSVKDAPNDSVDVKQENESASMNGHDKPQDADTESCDTTLTISSAAETVVDADTYTPREVLSNPDHNVEVDSKITEVVTNSSSDETDVVTPYPTQPQKTAKVASEESENDEKPKLVHSGEFHDIVVQTQVKRSESSVVREFKNVLVYFLLWDKT